MAKRLLQVINSVVLVCTLLLALSMAVFASEDTTGSAAESAGSSTLDLEHKGSITVTPKAGSEGAVLAAGTKLTCYQVGAISGEEGNLSYALTEAFAGSKADLSDLEAADLARTLAGYASAQGISGTDAVADSAGTVKFESLPLGVYLIVQSSAESGSYAVSPFLVTIPVTKDGAYVYDVDASPKAGVYSLVDITVKKVWNDGNNTTGRPGSITVTLYRAKEAVETATLSSANSWSHTWQDLEESDSYSVAESAVSGYTASYAQSGNTFTITNTTTSKLVQTGQLNWPIPILAGSGVALFALGWALVNLKGKKKTDD